ncbi:MAG: cytochrome c3 family protein [Desulfovibrio sp.]|uniref:cytochrome c3 family protein n=1 Tax=Desulfovibrio sp. 7SRBS1 TaxID=3378064 RepID=UPI003B401D39
MVRKLYLVLIAAFIVAITTVAAMAFNVPDAIVLERPENNKKLNQWVGPVKFPHGFHAVRQACRNCHHKETDADLGKYVACRQCHTDDDPNNISGFYRAWHSEGPPSCLGCHTQMRTRGGKNPVGCTSACHKPKESQGATHAKRK